MMEPRIHFLLYTVEAFATLNSLRIHQHKHEPQNKYENCFIVLKPHKLTLRQGIKIQKSNMRNNFYFVCVHWVLRTLISFFPQKHDRPFSFISNCMLLLLHTVKHFYFMGTFSSSGKWFTLSPGKEMLKYFCAHKWSFYRIIYVFLKNIFHICTLSKWNY